MDLGGKITRMLLIGGRNSWSQVEGLVAVGGSDAHRPDPYVIHGMPTTWVYSKSLTSSEILKSIDKGHVVLSYSPDGPFIGLTCGTSITGDVCEDMNQPVQLNGEGCSI